MPQLGQGLRKGADNISQSAGFGERHAFRSSKSDIHGASVAKQTERSTTTLRKILNAGNKKGQFGNREKTQAGTKLLTRWEMCLSRWWWKSVRARARSPRRWRGGPKD